MIENNNIVVTTNVKNDDNLIKKAKDVAKLFGTYYVKRERKTIKELVANYQSIIVIYKNKIEYIDKETKIFFHLDTAIVRIKNNNDPLIRIIGEEKQNILDLTLGMGRDSVVMSYFGHSVTSLESNELIAFIVEDGLKNYTTNNEKLNDAMKKITVINVDNLKFLKTCKTNSYDIIYLDPMFEYKIKHSTNLERIEKFTNKSILTNELFTEIKRVAKKKIIIKAHSRDTVFEKFNFKVEKRAGSKFDYGIYEIGDNDV